MDFNIVGLLVFGVLISTAATLELPSYIKKCKRGDTKCYVESAQAALGHFINDNELLEQNPTVKMKAITAGLETQKEAGFLTSRDGTTKCTVVEVSTHHFWALPRTEQEGAGLTMATAGHSLISFPDGSGDGEKNYRLQSLNPFLVKMLEIHQGGLNIKMHDVKIYFAENLKFKEIRMDFDKMIFGYTFSSPLCQMLGDYEVDGKILILPISGSGKCNITIVDLVLDYEAQCAFEKREDGEEYITFLSGKHTTVSVGRGYYYLENLFNGDKTLGETTLKFMNENWLEIYNELDDLFLEALGEQERITLNIVAGSIPFNKLFLP